MDCVKFYKEVESLPEQTEADSFYYVLKDGKAVPYLTANSGQAILVHNSEVVDGQIDAALDKFSSTMVVTNIVELNAVTGSLQRNALIYVRDASGDPSAPPGAALYLFNVSSNETLRIETETSGGGNPPGSIVPFAGADVPSGYLACNGAQVSRVVYAALFSAIGTIYGVGDGSTTFALPDLRGRFLRGLGGNSAALGVPQGDAIRNIYGHVGMVKVKGVTGAFTSASGGTGTFNSGSYKWDRSYLSASRQVPTAAENRPINMAMNYVIKY